MRHRHGVAVSGYHNPTIIIDDVGGRDDTVGRGLRGWLRVLVTNDHIPVPAVASVEVPAEFAKPV